MNELNVEVCQIQLFWLVERKTDPSLRIVSSFDFEYYDDTPGVIWWNQHPLDPPGFCLANHPPLEWSWCVPNRILRQPWPRFGDQHQEPWAGSRNHDWVFDNSFFLQYTREFEFSILQRKYQPPKKCHKSIILGDAHPVSGAWRGFQKHNHQIQIIMGVNQTSNPSIYN